MAVAFVVTIAVALSVAADGPAQPMGCGEFCVRFLCEYYDVEFQEEEGLRTLALGPYGETSLERMEKCLETLGFECSAMRGGYEDLEMIDSPTIVFLESDPDVGGHFGVVVKSPQTGELLAYDFFTSKAPAVIEREVFLKHWRGAALFATPARPHYKRWIYAVVGGCAILFGVCLAHVRARGNRPATKEAC